MFTHAIFDAVFDALFNAIFVALELHHKIHHRTNGFFNLFLKKFDHCQTFQLVNMGAAHVHPIPSNYWKAGAHEIVSHCAACGIGVDGLEFAAHLFNGDPNRKAFIFYHFSQGGGSNTTGISGSGSGASGGTSRTIPDGTPLVKMLRRPHKKHMCVGCFEKYHGDVFKSVALSLKGKAAFINSGYTLNPASYGDERM